jgi:hypothetical protein
MYVRAYEGTGLGDVTFNPKYSGKDYMWSDTTKSTGFTARPPFVAGNKIERTLKIRFSADWPTFRSRLRQAFGRFMPFRSDGGKAVDEEIDAIASEVFHEKVAADKKAKTFLVLPMTIFYLKRASGDWILNNYSFPETWVWE